MLLLSLKLELVGVKLITRVKFRENTRVNRLHKYKMRQGKIQSEKLISWKKLYFVLTLTIKLAKYVINELTRKLVTVLSLCKG